MGREWLFIVVGVIILAVEVWLNATRGQEPSYLLVGVALILMGIPLASGLESILGKRK
jgi:hypothetical protein